MNPHAGERLLRFVGDRIRFELRPPHDAHSLNGWRAALRTNLGRAEAIRREIIEARFRKVPLAGASWRDIPMQRQSDGSWTIELPLTEVGWFKAKPCLVDTRGWQHWPDGPDVGVTVHPDRYRTANTIYCAFVRMFGPNKSAVHTLDKQLDGRLKELDSRGYTVIPPSGKLRDLKKELPHIIDKLGCRIVHLLPVNPTPTTFARFGRFGSPYAIQDLTAIDPALVEFDRKTTGVDQFCELADDIHARGARLFLDVVINHTGWGSSLQESHPEWFLRKPDGEFASPGAWGNTWADLVELEHKHPELWETLADAFLTWCRRGVDGFRCDAGYKVPSIAWQYIIARVRQEFPETIFLLEGLGGGWRDTETLLTEGGMQWAYSELFQEFNGVQVQGYLDHALKQSARVGLLVHYSETHDNHRLAACASGSGAPPAGQASSLSAAALKETSARPGEDFPTAAQVADLRPNRAWSLHRNRLCAFTSVSGGYGFTCGVEWLATEKVDVHSARGMAWGRGDNIVEELARVNTLLAGHPCFFDNATLTRLSPPGSPVFALRRDSSEGLDAVLVLVNTDAEKPRTLALNPADLPAAGAEARGRGCQAAAGPTPSEPPLDRRGGEDGGPLVDLLGQPPPKIEPGGRQICFTLPPLACFCLAASPSPRGLSGEAYRTARAQAAWALEVLAQRLSPEDIGQAGWRELASLAAADPARFLSATLQLTAASARAGLLEALRQSLANPVYPRVVRWSRADVRRVTLVPPDHWLLIEDDARFRATLQVPGENLPLHAEAVRMRGSWIATFKVRTSGDGQLRLERYASDEHETKAAVRFLAAMPDASPPRLPEGAGLDAPVVLLTNGIGGMARMRVDLGQVKSKYDCALAANLHASLPVDRHVFVKRVRVWCNADGFLTPLNGDNLVAFRAGPPAVWSFCANAGDGRAVPLELVAEMVAGQNTTVLRLRRPARPPSHGTELPAACDVRLTVRVDIEDRNFHWETKRNGGAEHHFTSNVRPLSRSRARESATGSHAREPGRALANTATGDWTGFEFTPAAERQLRVIASRGVYHHGPEWSHNLPHLVEQSRGQEGAGDAFSPGWFEIPIGRGEDASLVLSAESAPVERLAGLAAAGGFGLQTEFVGADRFADALRQAAQAYVVRRGEGRTVIAGYPWFLDWGRDTLIAARGLLAAGRVEEVKQMLVTFARFEDRGTLPNTIHGDNASNRDTSDAPLWFGVVCEELAAMANPKPGIRNPKEARSAKSEETASDSGRGDSRLLQDSDFDLRICSTAADASGRTLSDVLRSIAVHYVRGTPNGIRTDPASGLVWSPSHFTWMDTNHPPGTPREGYPVEIQALWIRLLRQLARLGVEPEGEPWDALAAKAEQSFHNFFWLEEEGWLADVLLAKAGEPARTAVPDHALRSNMLFAVTLGLVSGERARRCVDAALRHLVVPGALRSLAPLPATPPLAIRAHDGRLLNDPLHPYWGRYEGDEDTRRKPAYHNGTAWVWTFPVFCEALARAWDGAPEALAAARAYLGSVDRLLWGGCVGQLPEIVDGDAPHQQRGCDAQAWSVTETLRVWEWLKSLTR